MPDLPDELVPDWPEELLPADLSEFPEAAWLPDCDPVPEEADDEFDPVDSSDGDTYSKETASVFADELPEPADDPDDALLSDAHDVTRHSDRMTARTAARVFRFRCFSLFSVIVCFIFQILSLLILLPPNTVLVPGENPRV